MPSTMEDWALIDLYKEAERRVDRSPALSAYKHIIMSDGYADSEDHLRWVIRGRVGEIESWAKEIANDRA